MLAFELGFYIGQEKSAATPLTKAILSKAPRELSNLRAVTSTPEARLVARRAAKTGLELAPGIRLGQGSGGAVGSVKRILPTHTNPKSEGERRLLGALNDLIAEMPRVPDVQRAKMYEFMNRSMLQRSLTSSF